VVADAHRVPGAVWSLGKTLAENVRKDSRIVRARQASDQCADVPLNPLFRLMES
jgi:hypothetical protein